MHRLVRSGKHGTNTNKISYKTKICIKSLPSFMLTTEQRKQFRHKNFRSLPKFSNRHSYLYVEHCKIDVEDWAVVMNSENTKTSIPTTKIASLLLGPGTSITHAAVSAVANDGCSMLWVGEHGVKFYASGSGLATSSGSIARQALMWCDPVKRASVAIRMYEKRFGYRPNESATIDQIMGMEGSEMRKIYKVFSHKYGIRWDGRNFKNKSTINRAISVANSVLYGIGHAAIISAGYSAGLGFMHSGTNMSFVYDIADLYKVDTSITIAFQESMAGEEYIETIQNLLSDDKEESPY